MFERLKRYVSDQTGLGRLRKALAGGGLIFQAGGAYRGADITRLNKSWQPQHYSGDGAIQQAWDLLTRRIRDLGRNDPAIIALREVLTNNVIRTGIATMAAATVEDDPDDEYNDESDSRWEEYCLDHADWEGKLSFQDIQRQLFKEMLEPGEALLLECADPSPDRPIPLCYQVLEGEQLDETVDRQAGPQQNEIVRGIELDRRRRPVAYWLFDVNPNDPHASYQARSVRVPAERILHLVLPGRPSATRGVSLYSAITQSARDLDNYLGTELTAAIIASLFTVVHKTGNPGVGMGFADGDAEADDYGNQRVKLGRGIVSQIAREDSVEALTVNRPNAQARTFVDLILMLIGMGGGISKYRLTRDYSATTYVAARAARLDDADAFEPMQAYFGRRVCRRVRRRWTQLMAGYGRFTSLTPAQFAAQPSRWLACELLYPGVAQIDKQKETDADLASLGAHTSTYQRIYARQGLNYRRELRQAKREKDFLALLQLQPNLMRPSTPAAGYPSDPNLADMPAAANP